MEEHGGEEKNSTSNSISDEEDNGERNIMNGIIDDDIDVNNNNINKLREAIMKEEEKQRLKNVIKSTRDSVKCFETNVSMQTLKITTDICAAGIKEVELYLVKNLGDQQSAGLLNIIAEIIHRVLNTVKLQENITKLGQDIVIDAVDKFINLIEEIMDKVDSYAFTQSWIQYCSLENLSTAFPISTCTVRKNINRTSSTFKAIFI
uniref:Uncharacterized protein n=1 Tax=Panagrolaimus superbus TaxID=310955 RepID=A0A914Z0A3_9BILA